ncbi:MAG: SusC/RagA family TonB-linked outer membrane protein [Ginsengibacter sp.]
MRKKLSLSGLFMLFCLLTMAQTRTVTGTVTSADGTPLVDASVIVVGQKTGVRTAADGTFSINLPAKAHVLQVSYVGSETQRVDVADLSSVKVTLQSSSQALTDVVIIGYGSARKKDLTGAVSSIKAKDFNQGVINSADQLLTNKVPGLEVTNTSGQPGAATTVQIRGSSSIRAGAQPLYVVDGVILDGGNARPDIGYNFGNTPGSDPLLFINPYDIAQIDVLKDASSTAIYGSRGANGVIIITTKKGGSGPMKVEANVSAGTFAGYMKRFEILSRSQFISALHKYTLDANPAKNDSLIGAYTGTANTDALKAITQNTISQNYSVALSGGNDNGKFRASFLASDNEGFIKKSNLKKYLASFNGQYNFLDNKLNLEFGLVAANYGEALVPVGNAGSAGNLVSAALSWNPTQPFKKNGKFYYPTNGSGNPLANSTALDDNSNVSEFLGHISASYKLLPNLTYKFLYGVNYGTGKRDVNVAGWIQGFNGVSGQGFAAILNAKLTTQIIDHTLNYVAHLSKDLDLDAVVGYEYYKRDYSNGGVTGTGFNINLDETNVVNIPYTHVFQDAKTQTPYGVEVDPTAELQSVFARATFSYLDRYILTGTIRSDGSSKFGTNNKYGYFPSGAFKWQISNENFMKGNKVFSNLGLRVSYGLTGNQEFPAGASREQFALTSFNSTPQVVNGNPNLKWESTKQFDGGIDFALARGKVYGSVDYYNKNTSDILFATTAIQPAPNSTSYINLKNANLINSGLEVGLGVKLIENKQISWDISGNFATNNNKVKNFVDPNTKRDLLIPTGTIDGQGVSGTLAEVFANNQPVNVFYLKPFMGFDQNGNQTYGDNPVFEGNPNPTVLAGVSTTLRYEKFTLGINMGGSFGYKIYNNTATNITNISGIAQGRNIDLAAYNSKEQASSAVGASSRFLENGNYWKLRNASITYNAGSIGKYAKNVNVYVTGSNLFVITKFTGFDPEVNINKANNGYPSRSIEYIPYPTPRTITVGLNFSL